MPFDLKIKLQSILHIMCTPENNLLDFRIIYWILIPRYVETCPFSFLLGQEFKESRADLYRGTMHLFIHTLLLDSCNKATKGRMKSPLLLLLE